MAGVYALLTRHSNLGNGKLSSGGPQRGYFAACCDSPAVVSQHSTRGTMPELNRLTQLNLVATVFRTIVATSFLSFFSDCAYTPAVCGANLFDWNAEVLPRVIIA